MQVRKAAGGVDKAPYRWSGECLVQLVRKEGLYNGLFRGLDATALREVPQFAVYYPLYEMNVRALQKMMAASNASGSSSHEKNRVNRKPSSSTPLPPHLLLLAGGVAGTVQWLPPFYCLDVLKSRMQSALPGVYDNVWDCAKKSYQQEGIGVFFRGLPVALIRAFPLNACIFLGYETTLAALHQEEEIPHLPPAE
ncbi:hypothetical protein NSK_002372 [Nannochloropsis salina CCMP1776]|uniref:Uncharacterized protein n=1 Tax=Nannochloropsis salina CCMP1776 TaxID=1027361 RepID=A0A4D9D591_9STRA|nr:hypothetical protein NSK_002372 [Nannochloropsis salina CCMP1776]|eukprot:TFJ86164.1 hypothetical protein NSK_002372 [Nannochloropsis salina CCMP1776]